MGSDLLRVIETDRFRSEAELLLQSDSEGIRQAVTWAVARGAVFGQRVKGTDQQVWVVYRGEFAYLAYYTVSDDTVTLVSLLRRKTPIAPGPLGLES